MPQNNPMTPEKWLDKLHVTFTHEELKARYAQLIRSTLEAAAERFCKICPGPGCPGECKAASKSECGYRNTILAEHLGASQTDNWHHLHAEGQITAARLDDGKKDFIDLPRESDMCPKGSGGHEFILIYKTDKVEIIKCKKCNLDSVGYFYNPWDLII